MTWDPAVYGRFADERTRPAMDLLARTHHDAPRGIVDLGCGTGAITAVLAQRWPGARVVGVDTSREMLAEAARLDAAVTWTEGDIATWTPREPVDVVFSNAALHWVGDHEHLLPRLLGHVAPAGVLAVQMPQNASAPTHTCLADAVAASAHADELRPLLRAWPVLAPARYHDVLAPLAESVDIWETRYHHVLHGPDPVFAWTSGALLRPVVAALKGRDDVLEPLLDDYRERLRHAYPRRPDGATLLPYSRLFVVTRRGGSA